jgi:hypothetical protein
MKMNKLYTTFLPNSHKGICEFGLSGQWHVENGSGLDGLQTLQAVDYTLCMSKDARCSRAPKMTICCSTLLAMKPYRHAADRPSEHIYKQLLKKTYQQNIC